MTRALLLSLLAACSSAGARHGKRGGGGDADTADTGDADDPTEHVYDPSRVVDVRIELDPGDWDELRAQTRDAFDLLRGDCLAEPFGDPFTWFSATVWLDGTELGPVAVRKKGFLGSLSDTKPSLKIDLAEYDDSLSWWGVQALTLNNSISDPSYLHQCLGYGVFSSAGQPAPRCNIATVTVNDEPLGVYVNVEPVKDPFLARHFGSDEGNLYEGTLSDFREGWTGTFDKKSGGGPDDLSDIEAVREALEAEDDALLAALEPIVDLDAFAAHWALEVLITHIDGYAWNTNNFYLYADPSDGRFHFIPWGIDSVFLRMTNADGVPDSVYAYGELARRLYGHPEFQGKYLDTLLGLLDTTWDEDALLAEIDALDTLIVSALPDDEWETQADAADEVRSVIEHRRDRILDEVEDGPIEWPYDRRESFCLAEQGAISATFDTTWDSLGSADPFTTGTAAMDLVWQGESIPVSQVGAISGKTDEQAVLYLAAWASESIAIVAYIAVVPGAWDEGAVPIDFTSATGGLYYYDPETTDDFVFLAYIVGELTLGEASLTSGGAVSGSLEGTLLTWGG